MPKLSIWFIRTALIYLFLGLTIGALLLIQKGLGFFAEIWILLPIHIEWMFFGWIFQLIIGSAFWILPRFSQSPFRGNETLVYIAYFVLNLGILFVVFVSYFQFDPLFTVLGRILEATAVILFAIHAWPRIRAFSE
jgi:hypothetical protein